MQIKILNKTKGIPGRPGNNFPYYSCRIIKDFKGNFTDGENIKLASGFVMPGADLNSEYLVLVWGRSSAGKPDTISQTTKYWLTDHYLVRGNSTNNEGFFPVVNGMIIDRNHSLRFEEEEIPIEEFETAVKNFINNRVGVSSPKNKAANNRFKSNLQPGDEFGE